MHLRARQYAPGLGRFLQRDTVSPNAPGTQGYNPYAYAANNPATWTDPRGQSVGGGSPEPFRCPPNTGIAGVFWCVAAALRYVTSVLECHVHGECFPPHDPPVDGPKWTTSRILGAFRDFPPRPDVGAGLSAIGTGAGGSTTLSNTGQIAPEATNELQLCLRSAPDPTSSSNLYGWGPTGSRMVGHGRVAFSTLLLDGCRTGALARQALDPTLVEEILGPVFIYTCALTRTPDQAVSCGEGTGLLGEIVDFFRNWGPDEARRLQNANYVGGFSGVALYWDEAVHRVGGEFPAILSQPDFFGIWNPCLYPDQQPTCGGGGPRAN